MSPQTYLSCHLHKARPCPRSKLPIGLLFFLLFLLLLFPFLLLLLPHSFLTQVQIWRIHVRFWPFFMFLHQEVSFVEGGPSKMQLLIFADLDLTGLAKCNCPVLTQPPKKLIACDNPKSVTRFVWKSFWEIWIQQLKKYRLQSLEFCSNCGMTVHLSFWLGISVAASLAPATTHNLTLRPILTLFPPKPAVLNGSWVEKCATFSRHRSSGWCRTHKAPAPTRPYPVLHG